jgi:hypothetical protein
MVMKGETQFGKEWAPLTTRLKEIGSDVPPLPGGRWAHVFLPALIGWAIGSGRIVVVAILILMRSWKTGGWNLK